MTEISRVERRALFGSLAGLMTEAMEAFDIATSPDCVEDPAARNEAALRFVMLDAEIERRLDLLGMRALFDRGGH
jgi:hypothetical protein